MATQYLAVSVLPAAVSISGRGEDTTLTAVGDAVSAALAVEGIEEVEGAVDAINAIATAAAGAKPSGDLVVSFDGSVITTRNQLRRAIEGVLRAVDGSNLLE